MERLHNLAEELEALGIQSSKLGWAQYTAGYDFGIQEIQKKILEFMGNEEHFKLICDLRKKELRDADKRKVDIMYNLFKSYHLSHELNELRMEMNKVITELSGILNTHRTEFEGRVVSSVELAQIISSDENRERRKNAYMARNQINKPLVDAGFIKLLNLRKEYAKKAGYEDFVSMQLDDQELHKNLFKDWKEQLEGILPEMNIIRENYAKKYLNDTKVMPWDEAYINSKIAPALNTTVDMSNYYNVIHNFFKKFGIDISTYNITYDIFPRANKSEWGYNFPIETGKDSRVLANVKNKYNEFGVLLHETGHAVHSFLKDPNEKILNEGISGIITEGIANLFGSFLYKEIFYKEILGDDPEIKRQFDEMRKYNKVNSLRAMGRILFDQSLYTNDVNSLEDINALYWKNHKELFNEEPFSDNPPWAFTIHYTTHPIYLHNYFMGDVTCEMLAQSFNKKFNVSDPSEKPEEFAKFLIEEVINPSGMYTFGELFEKISGKQFSIEYMIK